MGLRMQSRQRSRKNNSPKLQNVNEYNIEERALFYSSCVIANYSLERGHDYKELLRYLEIAKNSDKPVILHVITQKGKGYKPAEINSSTYHGR